jgi:5-methylcytosine-specific restriction protein A
MPFAAPRPCPSCGRAAIGGVCPVHGAPPASSWDIGRPPVARLRGANLQAARRRLFARHPLCEPCLAKSPAVYTLAVLRDHRIPLAEGGDESAANEQAICRDCHDQKTQREARRGARRV